MSDLKPCPFCGEAVTIQHIQYVPIYTKYFEDVNLESCEKWVIIGCSKCKIGMTHPLIYKEALELINKRTNPKED